MPEEVIPTLSILMPVYNEVERVAEAIDAVLATEIPVPTELIVVDDGSTDGSCELLRSRQWGDRVSLVEHAHNQGKGAAVRTALQHARGEYAAIFDADLEYDPKDITQLLPFVLDGRANACFGQRAFDGYSSHSFWFVMGNRAVTLACNVIFNVYLHDIMTCHKVMRTNLFRSLDLKESGFAIEAEIAARLVQRGERIFEVPVHYQARSSEEGKKITAYDALRCMRTLLRCRLTPPAGASLRR